MIRPAQILYASTEEEMGIGDWFEVTCTLNTTCRNAQSTVEFAQDPVGTITDGAFEELRELVNAGITEMVSFLATMWIRVPLPNITGVTEAADTSRSAGALSIDTVLNWVMYIGFAVVIGAVIGLGAMMAVRLRQGEGMNLTGRLGLSLFGAVLIGGASSIAAALANEMWLTGSSTIVFVQNQLFWVAIAIVVLSIIVAGVRMAVDQKGQHGIDLAKSLGIFIVAAGAGTAAVSMLVLGGHEISVALLDASLECDEGAGRQCFGEGMARVLNLDPTGVFGWNALGVFWTVLLGIVLAVVGLIQLVLMYLRTIIISALLGFLLVAAAGTNMKVGRQMWEKYAGWMLAFILYEPAAAAIYATAFYPITDLGTQDAVATEMMDQFWGALGGIVLMVLALFALPALMKLLVPATSAMVGAAGGGMAGGMMAAGTMAVAGGAKTVAAAKTGGATAGAGGAASSAGGARGSGGGGSGGGGGAMQQRGGSPPQPVSPNGASTSGQTASAGSPTSGSNAAESTNSGSHGGRSNGSDHASSGATKSAPSDAGGSHDTPSGAARSKPPPTSRGTNDPRPTTPRWHGQGGNIGEQIVGDDDQQEDGPDGSKR